MPFHWEGIQLFGDIDTESKQEKMVVSKSYCTISTNILNFLGKIFLEFLILVCFVL